MTERPSFLPPAEFVPVAPEQEGFTAALGRARRRRRRQVGEAGVALGLAVALLTSMQVPTRESGQDRVDVTDSPQGEHTDDSTPDDVVTDDTDAKGTTPDTGSDSDAAAGTDTDAGRGGSGARAGSLPGAEPAAPPAPGRAPTVPRRGPRESFARRNPVTRTANAGVMTCVTGSWCVYAYANETAANSNNFAFSVEVCRALDAPATQMDFDTDHEVELVVQDRAGDVWTWSRGQSFEYDPETITFRAGGCYTWKTQYFASDDYGTLPDPGTYTLRVWSVPVGKSKVGTTTFTIH